MNSPRRQPRKSPQLTAMLGIGVLLSLPVLAQPREQSPVDISRSNTVRDPNPPHLDFNYGIATVRLTNTYGNTDETSPGRVLAKEWGTLKALPEPGSEVRLNGIPYDLVQFHFHAPSEHTVNGRRTDMEVHFVHLIRNSQGGAAACASSNRPLLVIGVFIDAGNSDRELDRLFPPNLPRRRTDPDVNVDNVDLRALVPAGSPTWRYDGGLTAPANDCPNFSPLSTQAVTGDFPEAVHWYIYDRPMHLSRTLIDRFTALFPEGNARLLKAVNDRTIFALHDSGK